jgi:ADP-dependent NAD(P)H-hydrate dehydratase / NAD(P)H-hydrate epimerase
MKIFSCSNIRKIDEYTISHEPIGAVDLMERAACRIFEWFTTNIQSTDTVCIFCGPGNNGGDGLALARMLAEKNYTVKVFILEFSSKHTSEWETNLNRIERDSKVSIRHMEHISQFPLLGNGEIIVDAIFGSGLTRPADGLAADTIEKINASGCKIVAIDVPSGLFGEDNRSNHPEYIIKADHTLSFQFPKLSFMFPENEQFTGQWVILPIGLHADAISRMETNWYLTEKPDILLLLKERKRFDHKGSFGHGLLLAGSYGRMGAAVLSARAALKTGVGLLTCRVPACGSPIMQTGVPEAMLIQSDTEKFISGTIDTQKFSAIGIGPGIGTGKETADSVHSLISGAREPMVIDADGLNLLSANKEWLGLLKPGTILTPHLKEFERLAGTCDNGYTRLELQSAFSAKYKCIVVLKGANTSISLPEGIVYFNSTGNPGMATAGSGDVLTGIMLSLLAQGYEPADAARLGVYLHGLAGDLALSAGSEESLIASDIIDNIGFAFEEIRKK